MRNAKIPEILLAYTYLGREFEVDLSAYAGGCLWYFWPSTGIYSYSGKADGRKYQFVPLKVYDKNLDAVLVVCREIK